MAELAGIMVGNYFLLECLGREGMVETYLARPTNHGGFDVHLRLLHPNFPDPIAFQEHFPTEVRKVWRCQHEHIQPLVEFGEGDGLIYTATRADSPPTLAQLLERQGQAALPLPLIAQVLTQLCSALQYAHERDIVHGNIQPSSVLLAPNGQAILTNFALKQQYHEGDPMVAQVEEGNAAYIAPEQVVGMLAPASDIYALGVLLYRLFGGVLPYEGASAGEIALLHANQPIPSLHALCPDLPEEVELVVRVALAKSSSARFATPSALATAFLQALAMDSAPVSADVPSRRIMVKARRTDLTWARVLSLLALTLICTGLVSTIYLFSFSAAHQLPGIAFHQAGFPGDFPLTLPPFGPGGFPTLTPTAVQPVASPQPTPGAHPTPIQAQVSPTSELTPALTPTVNIQQTPIVFPSFAPSTPTVPPVATPQNCVPGSLKVNGSFYLAPVLQQVSNDYQTFCPGLHLTLANQGEMSGLNALMHGQTDLAATDQSVTGTQQLTDDPAVALLYAVVVSPDIQLSGLSSAQLQAIYQGQITNWSQVGGPDEAIKVLLHPSTDPLKALFRAFVLNGQAEHVQGIRLNKETPLETVQQVSQTIGAITYVPLAVTQSASVHVLAIDNVQPTLQNLFQGSYAFWSVEHLYAKGAATAQAQAYLQFLQSASEASRMAQDDAVLCALLSPDILATHLPGPQISV
jgi:ABC-type phosphate transport system substrate-binding protein